MLDTGTFHGLGAAQRVAMGSEVACRGGASQSDVETAFPDWEVTDIEVADTDPDPIAKLFKFEERFSRLRRRRAA